MSTGGEPWLGRGDAPVDRSTWCWIPAGQVLLTRRATACEGRDLLHTDRTGARPRTQRLGRYVRHAEYAAAAGAGTLGEITHIAAALDAVGVAVRDLAALTLCAPAPLAAAIAARLPRLGTAVWQTGADRALATGADADLTSVRLRLLTALDTGSRTSAAVYEQWLTLPDLGRAAIYAGAGLTWREALIWERDRRYVCDLDSLATLAALRGAAA